MNKYGRKMIGKKYGYKPKMKDIAWFIKQIEIWRAEGREQCVIVTSDSAWLHDLKEEIITCVAVNSTENDNSGRFITSVPAVAAAAGWTVGKADKIIVAPFEQLFGADGGKIPETSFDEFTVDGVKTKL